MFELDDNARRALRERYEPLPDAQARVLEQLRATLGGPAGPDGGDPDGGSEGGTGGEGLGSAAKVGPAHAGGQLAWVAKIVAATIALTGAGLLVVGLGAGAVNRRDRPQPARTPASAPRVDSAATSPASLEQPAPEAPEVLEAEADPTPSGDRPRKPKPAQASESSPGLAAELALLDAAERARAHDPSAALRLLQQHRREFPRGALAHEREVLRTRIEADRSGTDSAQSGD